MRWLATLHGAGLVYRRSHTTEAHTGADPFTAPAARWALHPTLTLPREALCLHLTPHLTHLTRLAAAEGLGHNLMAGLRAGGKEVPRLLAALRKPSHQ